MANSVHLPAADARSEPKTLAEGGAAAPRRRRGAVAPRRRHAVRIRRIRRANYGTPCEFTLWHCEWTLWIWGWNLSLVHIF